MNRLLANSLLRRCAITGENVLQSSELSAAVVFSLRSTVICRDEDFGNFNWRRMISSAAEPTAKAPSVKKKEKKEGDEVVPSSYWGISRSKVMRDDGTEWPWNCFMVGNLFLYLI